MMALQLIPLLLCWGILVLVLQRCFPEQRAAAGAGALSGFCAGVAGQNLLFSLVGGELPFRLLRGVGGASFLLLWVVSVAALYRAGSGTFDPCSGPRRAGGWAAGSAAALTGALAGAISLCRLAPLEGGAVELLPGAALAAAGVLLAVAALGLGPRLPERIAADGSSLAALLISGILFMACSLPRLDLFSPLSMEVMKFIHDFVHQFFESMLIPDHPFFRSESWDYIGLLFGDQVGFWGGLLLWFTPVLLVALAVRLQRLPSVAHIRQGAGRRKLLARFIRNRRYRQAVPLLALLLLAGAVYRSRFSSVEYWDPKPLPVSASASGEILIPRKGEVDLEDGKLHKFIFRQGGREARFFVVRTPSGRLSADLDACAICKPDGYGQSGETVLCYYCNTLIPMETVGKPGGCNPVPIPFTSKGDAIGIDGPALLNKWGETVQETTRVKGGGR